MFCGSAFRSRTRPTTGFRAVGEVPSVSHIVSRDYCGARSDGETKDGGNLDEFAAPDADAVGVRSPWCRPVRTFRHSSNLPGGDFLLLPRSVEVRETGSE